MKPGILTPVTRQACVNALAAMTVYSIYEEVSGGGEEDWNQPTPRLSRCALSLSYRPPVCSWSKALFGNAGT